MAFTTEAALGYLESAHRQGRLAHAYLVTGAVGSVVQEFALSMIRMVNGEEGSSLEEVCSGHVHLLRPESKSRRITVKQVRELEKRLYMGAPSGKTKVAVIQDADRLGQEAENAFLKTLEEPPDGSLILLLSSQPQQLLDTILSRCLRVPLRGEHRFDSEAAEENAVLEVLEAHLRDAGGSATAALGLAGRFSGILRELKTGITKRYDLALKEETKIYAKRIEGDWLAKREDYYKAVSETEYLERRNRLVDCLLAFLGDALRQQHGVTHLDLESRRAATEAMARRCAPAELSRRFGALERMRTLLETNASEKLVFEVSFLEAFG
jgi:DNA polymerase-3 subunit delta'